jgi:drug/metabolite transporter (DMT)-like permease
MSGSTGRPQLVAGLAVIYGVWGSTYVALKVGVESLPPLALSAARFLLAGAVLYAWCAWRRRRSPQRGWRAPTAAQWRAGVVLGVLLPAAGTGGATWAEQRLPSGTTALFLATIPVWLVLTKRIVDREPIGRRAGLGLVAGLVGVAVLANPFGGPAPAPLYTAVALGGALCWGAGTVYGQHAPRPAQPLLASAIEMLGAGGVLLVLSLAAGERWPAGATGRSLLALGYLVVFGSLVAYTTYEWLVHRAPARLVGTYAFVNPVVAVALGRLLLGERVGPRTLIASAVIATGVALIVTQPEPRARRKRPVSRTTRAARSRRCTASGSAAAR